MFLAPFSSDKETAPRPSNPIGSSTGTLPLHTNELDSHVIGTVSERSRQAPKAAGRGNV